MIKLNEKSNFGVLIGKGFGHAIFTLKRDTHVIYFSNSTYSKKFSRGLRYNDKKLKLKLPLNLSLYLYKINLGET